MQPRKRPPLPPGVKSLAEFGRIMAWGRGDEAARERAESITIAELRAMRMEANVARIWRDLYLREKARNPSNPSAAGRAELMQRVIDLVGQA